MNTIRLQILGVVLAFVSGCANDLPKISELGEFRILGIKMNNPEVAVGDPDVNVSVLLSDIEGAGARSVAYSVSACLDPGVSIGADANCDNNPTRVVVTSGTIAAGSFLAATNYTASLTNLFTVTVPGSSLITLDPLTGSTRTAQTLYNGVSYLLDLRFTPTGGATYAAIKRLIVSNKPVKNLNPTLNSIAQSGGVLSADIATGSRESYILSAQTGFQTLAETLSISWFVSSGKVKRSITSPDETNEFTADDSPPAVQTFIAVLRDLRGGIDWVVLNQ